MLCVGPSFALHLSRSVPARHTEKLRPQPVDVAWYNGWRRATRSAFRWDCEVVGSVADDANDICVQTCSRVGRRQTMSALTISVTANRATSDTIGEILSDIQTQAVQARHIIDRHRTMLRSRQLDMKPMDLHVVINDSLALVDHDMKARQIEATVNLSPNPCLISGDQVLLGQVLVNLVVNAMDVMTDTTPARRHIRPSSPRIAWGAWHCRRLQPEI